MIKIFKNEDDAIIKKIDNNIFYYKKEKLVFKYDLQQNERLIAWNLILDAFKTTIDFTDAYEDFIAVVKTCKYIKNLERGK